MERSGLLRGAIASEKDKFVYVFKLGQAKEAEEQEEAHRQNLVTSAEFSLHWPVDRRTSIWHFKTATGMHVHLKYGWNIFGRRDSSHIEIKEPDMKSTEFCIRVLGYRFLLMVYDIAGNLEVNGKRTYGETVMVESGAIIGVIIQNVRVVYFEFLNYV